LSKYLSLIGSSIILLLAYRFLDYYDQFVMKTYINKIIIK